MNTFGHQAGTPYCALWEISEREHSAGRMSFAEWRKEFAFVLAGASLDAARTRAELLREMSNS